MTVLQVLFLAVALLGVQVVGAQVGALYNTTVCGPRQRHLHSMELQCSREQDGAQKEDGIDVRISNHSLPRHCPCAYDKNGKCRQSEHMCGASTADYFCSFTLKNVFISSAGGLLDCRTLLPISFAHPTMMGAEPIYYPKIHRTWADGYIEAAKSLRLKLSDLRGSTFRADAPRLAVHDVVVPTRMRWDDCFNHLSFQSVPLIAHVYEFWGKERWEQLSWHASLFTAGVLRLLDVPMERIILAKNVFAKTAVLPWVRGWCPPQISTLFGVAANVSALMTRRLLQGPPWSAPLDSGAGMSSRAHRPGNYSRNRQSENMVATEERRTVIYMPRSKTGTRFVVNEDELLRLLRENLRPEFELHVHPYTPEYDTIEKLLDSWREAALIFSRARLIIGPHGGAFNNLMWVPADVDIIEFNEFPDDTFFTTSHGGTAVRHVFLTAAWARGIRGKFWIVQPSMKHFKDFYTGKLRVAPRDLMAVLLQIGGVLKEGATLDNLQTERHGTWPVTGACYTCIPPPE